MQFLQKLHLHKMSPRRIKSRAPLWGFEMVEALVAIVILTLAIIGPMALAVQTAKYSRVSLDRVVGSYLADEGLDLMINYRQSLQVYCNSEYLEPAVTNPCGNGEVVYRPSLSSLFMFISDFGDCADTSAGCVIDVDTFDYGPAGVSEPKIITGGNNGGIKKATDSSCPVLYVSNRSLASCDTDLQDGEVTKFTRIVYVREITEADIRKCHSLTTDEQDCLNGGNVLPASQVAEVVSVVCPNAPPNGDGVTCNEDSENAIVVRAYVTS